MGSCVISPTVKDTCMPHPDVVCAHACPLQALMASVADNVLLRMRGEDVSGRCCMPTQALLLNAWLIPA